MMKMYRKLPTPPVIKMFISNANMPRMQMDVILSPDAAAVAMAAAAAGTVAAVATKVSNALSDPMILRIHNAKSGCGSCGR